VTQLTRMTQPGFNADIGMSFGAAKCAHVGIRMYDSDGIAFPSANLIRSLSYDETYKYLGIFENFDIQLIMKHLEESDC